MCASWSFSLPCGVRDCACAGGAQSSKAQRRGGGGAAPGGQLGRKEGTARAQLEVIPYAVTHDARSTVVIEGLPAHSSLWVNGMAGLAVHVPAATRVKAETG